MCTLYPDEGFFAALIVIGAKGENEAELLLGGLTEKVADLYRKAPFSCGGRWLMIGITNLEILEDVKQLIMLRVKPKAA